jgi:Ca2+-binding RTX toxin-like protein
MLMSARSVLESVRLKLQSRPRKRRQKSRWESPELLEQRALLSSISISGGTLNYEAADGEMNRVRIRPLRNGAAYEITEEARLFRNQVDDQFTNPGTDTPVEITVGELGGLSATESSGSYGNRVVINDPERTITAFNIELGDENDVVQIHTARVGSGASSYYAPATVSGGDGNDAIVTGWGDDVIDGGDGHDHIFTNSGDDVLIGGDGGDRLEGGNGNDTLEGNDGSDTLYGGQGNDLLVGGDENDRLEGGNGEDTLDGGDGDDHLTGGWHSDLVIGGNGSDLIMAQWGSHGLSDGDTVIGGLDDDRDGVQDAADSEIDVINADQGDDDLQGIDATFADLRGTYVFNTGNMHHWAGFENLPTIEEWRAMSGAQQREYWLSLRSHWNMEWSDVRRAFYSTTARF